MRKGSGRIRRPMIRREYGFTLVELMVAMVVFLLVIMGASQVFTSLLTQFKQQASISQTNIEGMIGLEIMRRDIDQAGYGLPWILTGSGHTATYDEALDDTHVAWDDRKLNDGPPGNPARAGDPDGSDAAGSSNPPSPFRSLADAGISEPDGTSSQKEPYSSADVLAVKSSVIGMSASSQRWTYIANNGDLPNIKKEWNSEADPADSDQVIVIDPGNDNTENILRNEGGANFYESLGDDTLSFNETDTGYSANGFEPKAQSNAQFVVYGIAPHNEYPIRMPFNRADYYVKIPENAMPSRCAPHTGILYKAVIINSTNPGPTKPGGVHQEYPLLECVADMKVDFWLDTDASPDGIADWCPSGDASCGGVVTPTDDISAMTAGDVRKRVKEVRVYIVAQEGQKDIDYDFSRGGTRTSLSATEIDPFDPDTTRIVNMVDLSKLVGDPEYRYYRWKLYTLVVKPDSMR